MRIFALLAIGGFLLAQGSERSIETRSPSEIAAEKTAAEAPKGSEVFGLFVGRTPCQELSQLLNVPARDECNKIKCRLILYQDPVSKAPASFSWKGKIERTGKWSIVKGISRTAYKLEMGEMTLSLLGVDDNILYILNKEGEPLVGNWEFSYTLNRIIPVP
jgi:hypothetical protein